MVDDTTSDDLDGTKILTSTPVRSDPLPLRASTMETSSGDPIHIPSRIFGSPTSHDNQEEGFSSKAENVNKILDENLKKMKASLAAGKQRKKRQFFDTMIKGNNF